MTSNEEIELALNEHKLLVLLEQEDGKFRQVGLSPKMFKKVSDAIFTTRHQEEGLREGFEIGELHINPNWEMDADAFLGLSSFYKDLP